MESVGQSRQASASNACSVAPTAVFSATGSSSCGRAGSDCHGALHDTRSARRGVLPGRYSGHTHELYAAALRHWFGWCETSRRDPLVGIRRAHIELYIRHLHESGPRDSSVNTMMPGVRGFFRFAHVDGLVTADPRSTPGCRECTPTRPAPEAWTGPS